MHSQQSPSSKTEEKKRQSESETSQKKVVNIQLGKGLGLQINSDSARDFVEKHIEANKNSSPLPQHAEFFRVTTADCEQMNVVGHILTKNDKDQPCAVGVVRKRKKKAATGEMIPQTVFEPGAGKVDFKGILGVSSKLIGELNNSIGRLLIKKFPSSENLKKDIDSYFLNETNLGELQQTISNIMQKDIYQQELGTALTKLENLDLPMVENLYSNWKGEQYNYRNKLSKAAKNLMILELFREIDEELGINSELLVDLLKKESITISFIARESIAARTNNELGSVIEMDKTSYSAMWLIIDKEGQLAQEVQTIQEAKSQAAKAPEFLLVSVPVAELGVEKVGDFVLVKLPASCTAQINNAQQQIQTKKYPDGSSTPIISITDATTVEVFGGGNNGTLATFRADSVIMSQLFENPSLNEALCVRVFNKQEQEAKLEEQSNTKKPKLNPQESLLWVSPFSLMAPLAAPAQPENNNTHAGHKPSK